MSKLMKAIYTLRSLDDLALHDSAIHRLHPIVKVLATAVYIIAVVSFGRYDIAGLLPLVFFPVLVFLFADISFLPVLQRITVILPFIVLIGIFNPIFDTQQVSVGGLQMARGWITFFSLFVKGVLTVTAALLLIATTGMDNLAVSFRMLKIPKVLVLQILLTYRYITVLLEEANNTMVAYSLRAPLQKGVHYKVWGSLTGQLLLRTMDRAQRIYNAMCLRGFTGEYHTGASPSIKKADLTFLIGWVIFFITIRSFNVPHYLGTLFTTIIS